jgi:glucose-6-phosphate-specific signal transduction histidine kinase
MKYIFPQHAPQLEPITYIDAIRTFVALKDLLNKFTTSVVVENVDEVLLSVESTVIFFSVVIARKYWSTEHKLILFGVTALAYTFLRFIFCKNITVKDQ